MTNLAAVRLSPSAALTHAETRLFRWEQRIRMLRPQSYDIGIAIAVAVGAVAAYPFLG